MDTRLFIEQSDFFRSMSSTIKDRVSEICTSKLVKKKDMLFYEGNEGNTLFVNGTAIIQIYKTNPEGKPIVLRVIEQTELFGEVILFERNTYPVNAEVLKSGVVLLLAKKDFLHLLEEKDFRNRFLGDVFKKLRYFTEKIQSLSIYDAEKRFFLFLYEHYGKRQKITVTLTRKSIADAIGTSAETFSRILQRLASDGTLVWQKNTIVLRQGFWQDWFIE